VCLAVVRADGPTWFRTYGLANVAHELEVQRHTPFMLASISKTIVSVAVMQAVEDGVLELEADVQDVAGFPVRNPGFPDDPITLRMLLTHTSTISDDWDTLIPLYVEGDSSVALAACVARDLPVSEYAAKEIKLGLVGSGGADKKQVQHMVGLMLSLQGKLQADAADALAVAITHAHVRATANRLGVATRTAWRKR
jgi:CubicO group peptidase (beta-lactamase class C family)